MVLEQLGINTSGWLNTLIMLGIFFFIALVVLILMAVGIIFMLFNKKAYIFRMYGNVKINKLDNGKINYETIDKDGNKVIKEDLSDQDLELGEIVIKRSMEVVKNDVQISRIFYFPWYKATLPIPANYNYIEGKYFYQIGKELIPCKKPKMNIKGEIVEELADISNWIKWYYSEATGFIEKKFPETEAQVRVMAIIIVGIIVIMLLGGFELYLSYKYTGQILPGLNAVKTWFEANPGGINIPR